MAAEKITVPAAGRQLDVLATGPRDALTVVLHNGTPAGLLAAPPVAAAAAERGLRLVLYSRPGYGGSTPDPGRRVADAAGDVAALLDALGVAQFVTVGWSGGGPHALACAAGLPGRCLAPAWRGRRRTAPKAWTGWTGWAGRTWPSSRRRWPGRRR